MRYVFAWIFALFFLSSSYAQTPNQQLTDRSTVVLVGQDNRRIEFSVAEAQALASELHKKVDPDLLENQYLPPELRKTLKWIKDNAGVINTPEFPEGFNKEKIDLNTATIALANYCNITSLKLFNYPCITVHSSMLMIFFKLEYPMFLKPNRSFINTYAMFLGHEGIHLERGLEFFKLVIPEAELVEEEVRAWFRTIRDFARPLRLAGEPMHRDFEKLDGLLKVCNYKLPCKPFKDYLVNFKVSR